MRAWLFFFALFYAINTQKNKLNEKRTCVSRTFIV